MPLTAEQLAAFRNETMRHLDALIRAEADEARKAEMIATADEQAERMFTELCAEYYGA